MKTKLGISVGVAGAAIYLAALLGGYTPVLLLTGVVLLCEEDEWLKKTAVKAVALLMFFGFLLAIINLVPNCLAWINSIFAVVGGRFKYDAVSSIVTVFTKAIDIIRTFLFLILGLKALNQTTLTVPFVDDLINKNM